MFSILTSKIFGGLAIALAVAFVLTVVSKNGEISGMAKTNKAQADEILRLSSDVATLQNNQRTLEGGLAACNASVSNMKTTAEALTKAGVAAVQQVQKAGRAALSDKLAATKAMPKDTCEDAFNILKSN